MSKLLWAERGLGKEGEDPPLHTKIICFRCSILRSGYKILHLVSELS